MNTREHMVDAGSGTRNSAVGRITDVGGTNNLVVGRTTGFRQKVRAIVTSCFFSHVVSVMMGMLISYSIINLIPVST